MKTAKIIFIVFLALASRVFCQVSLDGFYKNWDITQQTLKAELKDKKIVENKVKGLSVVSFDDVLNGIQVRVDYTFNKEGRLTVKTIGNLTGEKDFKPLFDVFKSDALKRCGTKIIQKSSKGKNYLIWQPDENTRVFMLYGGLEVQYNIMKNAKAKNSN